MKKVLIRSLCYLITFTILFSTLYFVNSINLKRTMNNSSDIIAVTSPSGDVVAGEIVEGTDIKAVYNSKDKKYTLYRDGDSYELNVSKSGDEIVISIKDMPKKLFLENKVKGQFAIALPLIYWAPVLITAAIRVINCIVVATAGVYTTWFAVDSIAKTIDRVNVKNKTSSRSQTGYYTAKIINSTVVIGSSINFYQAVAALKSGFDVFSTTSSGANSATASAGLGGNYHHYPHGGDGYYPHWHPKGVSWSFNRNYTPHCWYGPVK